MRNGDENELLSPIRHPGPPVSQSTPRRPIQGPSQNVPRHGETLRALPDGDRAELVLEVRKWQQYYKGRKEASLRYKERKTNYHIEKTMSSFTIVHYSVLDFLKSPCYYT